MIWIKTLIASRKTLTDWLKLPKWDEWKLCSLKKNPILNFHPWFKTRVLQQCVCMQRYWCKSFYCAYGIHAIAIIWFEKTRACTRVCIEHIWCRIMCIIAFIPWDCLPFQTMFQLFLIEICLLLLGEWWSEMDMDVTWCSSNNFDITSIHSKSIISMCGELSSTIGTKSLNIIAY